MNKATINSIKIKTKVWNGKNKWFWMKLGMISGCKPN
jgi:hypothetical protein